MPRKQNSRNKKRPASRPQPLIGRAPPRNYLSTNTAGVTQQLRRTLVWNYTGVVTSTTAYAEYLVVALNSPYDPDSAIGGTSAVGYAKYMAFYAKCIPLASRVRVDCMNLSTSATTDLHIPTTFGFTVSTLIGSLGSQVAAICNGHVDYKCYNSSPSHLTLHQQLDVARFLDIPDPLTNPDLICTSGSGPNETIYGHLWSTSASNAGQVYVITVEFDCVFTDPIPFT